MTTATVEGDQGGGAGQATPDARLPSGRSAALPHDAEVA